MIERGSPPAKLHRICSRHGARTSVRTFGPPPGVAVFQP